MADGYSGSAKVTPHKCLSGHMGNGEHNSTIRKSCCHFSNTKVKLSLVGHSDTMLSSCMMQ